MRAVILAGGKGTRLRPYTVVLPKPLMPIGDYPILEVVVRQLARYGFSRITMAVSHHAEIMQAFFNDGRKWGIKIDYSIEDKPLGTMGPLRLIQDLPEDFLVMNGDILTDLDFRDFFNFHVSAGNIFTVSASSREEKSEYGVLKIGADNRLSGFEEKPVARYDVSMGVYMVNRKILEVIPEGLPYGFDRLMLDLIAKGASASVRRFGGYWLDIGKPDDYMKAIEEFEVLKDRFLR